MSKKRKTYRFVITKYKNHYFYFDMEEIEIDGFEVNNKYDGYRVTKKNEVYIKYSWQELEDWYADLGPCYTNIKEEYYRGKLILETSNKDQFITKFYGLTGKKPEIQDFCW